MIDRFTYKDLSEYEAEWRRRPQVEQVWMLPRQERVEPRYINNDFQCLVPELTALHETGDLGRFFVLSRLHQSITSELGYTRTIRLGHPNFPDYHFRINIGVMSQLGDGSFLIEPPNVQETVFTRTEVPPLSMSNWKIYADGTEKSIPSDQPLGAYTVRQSLRKLEKTLRTKELAGDRFEVVTPLFEAVVTNSQNEQYGVFDYVLPSDAHSLKFVYSYDQTYILAQMFSAIEHLSIYDQWHQIADTTCYSGAMYQSFFALGVMHFQDSIYHQFHRGNQYYREKNGIPYYGLVLSDCETLGDIASYPRIPVGGQESPYYRSLWKDTLHPIVRNTRINDPLDPLFSIPHTVNAMVGYTNGRGEKVQVDLYEQFSQIYEANAREEWTDSWNSYRSPFSTPKFQQWFRGKHNEAMKIFVMQWKDTSGLFRE